eukprot:m.150120 g.150120  ORF g.150120 m.150120 type:complete len:796 (-) comp24456_c0_seq2:20-2407(-)
MNVSVSFTWHSLHGTRVQVSHELPFVLVEYNNPPLYFHVSGSDCWPSAVYQVNVFRVPQKLPTPQWSSLALTPVFPVGQGDDHLLPSPSSISQANEPSQIILSTNARLYVSLAAPFAEGIVAFLINGKNTSSTYMSLTLPHVAQDVVMTMWVQGEDIQAFNATQTFQVMLVDLMSADIGTTPGAIKRVTDPFLGWNISATEPCVNISVTRLCTGCEVLINNTRNVTQVCAAHPSSVKHPAPQLPVVTYLPGDDGHPSLLRYVSFHRIDAEVSTSCNHGLFIHSDNMPFLFTFLTGSPQAVLYLKPRFDQACHVLSDGEIDLSKLNVASSQLFEVAVQCGKEVQNTTLVAHRANLTFVDLVSAPGVWTLKYSSQTGRGAVMTGGSVLRMAAMPAFPPTAISTNVTFTLPDVDEADGFQTSKDDSSLATNSRIVVATERRRRRQTAAIVAWEAMQSPYGQKYNSLLQQHCPTLPDEFDKESFDPFSVQNQIPFDIALPKTGSYELKLFSYLLSDEGCGADCVNISYVEVQRVSTLLHELQLTTSATVVPPVSPSVFSYDVLLGVKQNTITLSGTPKEPMCVVSFDDERHRTVTVLKDESVIVTGRVHLPNEGHEGTYSEYKFRIYHGWDRILQAGPPANLSSFVSLNPPFDALTNEYHVELNGTGRKFLHSHGALPWNLNLPPLETGANRSVLVVTATTMRAWWNATGRDVEVELLYGNNTIQVCTNKGGCGIKYRVTLQRPSTSTPSTMKLLFYLGIPVASIFVLIGIGYAYHKRVFSHLWRQAVPLYDDMTQHLN